MVLSDKKKKKTKGRQKVELKRIENEDARYVSFSKRRNSVFSKASEMSTLCGAEVLILIYSPTGRPHTFGSPDVNLLTNRFISGGEVYPIGSPSEQAYEKARIHGLTNQMMELSESVDALKTSNDAILESTMTKIQGLGLDENEDGMTMEKLAALNNKLIDFKEQMKSLLGYLTSEGCPLPPMGLEGDSLSYDIHQVDPYVEPSHSPIQQELLNNRQANSASNINPFEPILGPLDPFASLNPTRGLGFLESSELSQINYLNQNTPANENLFEPEFLPK